MSGRPKFNDDGSYYTVTPTVIDLAIDRLTPIVNPSVSGGSHDAPYIDRKHRHPNPIKHHRVTKPPTEPA